MHSDNIYEIGFIADIQAGKEDVHPHKLSCLLIFES